MASGWYDWLSARVHEMIDRTGLGGIETDGPYGIYHMSVCLVCQAEHRLIFSLALAPSSLHVMTYRGLPLP